MADVVKEIEFRVNANAAPVSNLKREIAGLQAQSKTTGIAMGRMVPKDLGNKLGALNEKTEKGRQLLTTFGGAMGGAAGNAVYYGGTIASVIGKFSLWELGAMAVTAAIAGLAWALSRETQAEKDWKKRLDGINEALEKMRGVLVDLEYATSKATHGWNEYGETAVRAFWNVKRAGDAVTVAREEYAQILERYHGRAGYGIEEVDEAGARLRDAEAALSKAKEQLTKAEEVRAAEEERLLWVGMVPSSVVAAKKPMTPEEIRRAQQLAYAARIKEFETEKEIAAYAAQVEADAAEMRLAAWNDEWDRRNEIMQAGGDEALRIRLGQLEFEQKAEEAAIDAKIAAIKKAEKEKEDIWQASIAASEYVARAVSNVADAVGASEKAKMIAVAIFTGITDTINAAHEYAEAAKYFAGAYTAALGAAHLAAAVMYTTSAALAFSKAGGAGGGGGGGGGSGRVGGGGGYGDSGRRDYGDDDRRGRVVTINVEGHVLTAGSAAGFIRAALDAAEDRAHPGRTRSEVA